MEKTEFEKLEKLVKAAKKVAATDWEKSFCKDQSERVKSYGDRVQMSEKQIACLQKIVNKNKPDAVEDEDEAATEIVASKQKKPEKELDDDDISF